MDWKYIWDHQIELPESVSIFLPSPSNIQALWNKVRNKELLFPDEACCLEDFEKAIMESVILTSGPALLRITKVVPLIRCELHGFVLETAITPFRNIFRLCMSWAFRTFKVKRVECFIPSSARSLGRFLRSCGFQKEGHLRSRRMYKGKMCPEDVYGLLQEDLHVSR